MKKMLLAVVLLLVVSAPLIADDWRISAKEAEQIMYMQGFPPTNRDLFRIVRGATVSANAEAAWAILATRAWERWDYANAVCRTSPPYQQRAWERLLAEIPSVDVLLELTTCAGPPYANDAWKILAQREVSNRQLIAFLTTIDAANESYRQLAFQRLLSQHPKFEDLQSLYNNGLAGIYQDLAWKLVWDHPILTEMQLEEIVVSCRNYRSREGDAAWSRLRDRGTADALTRIVNSQSRYGDEAWSMLYAVGPSIANLREIVGNKNLSESFRLQVALIALDRMK